MHRTTKKALVVTASAALLATGTVPAVAASGPPKYPYAVAEGAEGQSGDFAQGTTSTKAYISPDKPGVSSNDQGSSEEIGDDRPGKLTIKTSDGLPGVTDHSLPSGAKNHPYVVRAEKKKDGTLEAHDEGNWQIDSTRANASSNPDQDWGVFFEGVDTTASCKSGTDTSDSESIDNVWVRTAAATVKKEAAPKGDTAKTYKDVHFGTRDDVGPSTKHPEYTTSTSDVIVQTLQPSDEKGSFKSQGSQAIAGYKVTVNDYGVKAGGARGSKLGSHTAYIAAAACTSPKDWKPMATKTKPKAKVPTKIPAGDNPALLTPSERAALANSR